MVNVSADFQIKDVSWIVARCLVVLDVIVKEEKRRRSRPTNLGCDRSRLETKRVSPTEQSVSKDRKYLSVGLCLQCS